MGTVAESVVELEAMRREDSSWHPCQVSLSSDVCTGFGLIVDFGSHGSQYIIHTKEEALAHLRIRSTALQGDDCLDIKEGLHVLAYQETELKRLLFDAQVEKVCRVRHSKRIQCRCTFVIRWLQSDLKGETITVPSSSIMKLTLGKIDSHPTVGAFLNSGKAFNCSGVSPFSSLLEETVYETDLSRVVEKQIEEISKLAEASKNSCSEEILLLVKKEQARQVSLLCEQASQIQNNSRRTTRSQSKTQLEAKDRSSPSTELKHNRHHLSPLGARAALASLMFKFPQEAEFSICHLDGEGFINKSLSSPERHANAASLDVADKLFRSGACFQEKVSAVGNLFPGLDACPDQFTPKHTKNSILLDASYKSSQIKEYRGIQNKVKNPALIPNSQYCEGSNMSKAKTSLTCQVSDRKKNHPKMSTRLTRSAFRKQMEVSNDELEQVSSAEEMKLGTTVHATRLTQSMTQKEVKILTVEIKQGLEEREPVHDAWSDSTIGDLGTAEPKETRRKKPVSSSTHTVEMNFNATRKNKKLRVSDDIRITKITGGENNSGEGEDIQHKNCISPHQVKRLTSKKPELRFSPRLRFLPRTRSQKH